MKPKIFHKTFYSSTLLVKNNQALVYKLDFKSKPIFSSVLMPKITAGFQIQRSGLTSLLLRGANPRSRVDLYFFY